MRPFRPKTHDSNGNAYKKMRVFVFFSLLLCILFTGIFTRAHIYNHIFNYEFILIYFKNFSFFYIQIGYTLYIHKYTLKNFVTTKS